MKKIFFLVLLFPSVLLAQNVGVGTTSPMEKLDVAGSIKFSGSLMPDGSAGSASTVLTSNGPGAAPFWASATQNQGVYMWGSTSQVTLSKNSSITVIPGLSQSITVPSAGNYDVWIYNDGMANWTGTLLSTIDYNRCIFPEISIWIDNVEVQTHVFMLDNGSKACDGRRPWNISYKGSLSAGTHTIAVKARVYKWSSWMKTNTTKVMFGGPNSNSYNWSLLFVGLIKK